MQNGKPRPADILTAHRRMPTDAEAASAVLLQTYATEAAAEALLRAFPAEREADRVRVRFWLAVYARVVRPIGE
jgi:hypothetical protein